jgi:predicted nucleic acid-binding protein
LIVQGIYLDTNALIYALEGDDEPLRDAFRSLFRAIGSFRLHTSELSMAEMLVGAHRFGRDDLVKRYRQLFMVSNNGFVTVMPISSDVLSHAASFRGRQIRFLERRPSLLDSMHAATAFLSGCSHFITSDSRLKLWDQISTVPATADAITALLKEI